MSHEKEAQAAYSAMVSTCGAPTPYPSPLVQEAVCWSVCRALCPVLSHRCVIGLRLGLGVKVRNRVRG